MVAHDLEIKGLPGMETPTTGQKPHTKHPDNWTKTRWPWLKNPESQKWVALVSGHLDQNLRLAPPA